MIVDFIICCITYYLAFVLRIGSFALSEYFEIFLKTVPFVFTIKIMLFYYYELHRDVWEYISLENLINITKAASLSTILIIFVIFIINIKPYPRSVIFIDWLLTIILIGGVRLSARIIKSEKLKLENRKGQKKRVLIVGAGDAGVTIAKEIKSNPKINYLILGFIDDDRNKIGKKIENIEVLGSSEDIPKVSKKLSIQEIIIAIPSISGDAMRRIVNKCKESKVKYKTLPALSDIINGTISITQIKDVDVTDFLRRSPKKLNTELIASHIYNKKVLVTGAAGSIGTELCNQIAKFDPSYLIVIDMAETPLYLLEHDLKSKYKKLPIISYLADIKDYVRTKNIIKDNMPNIIYHTAAYKHVPVLEENIIPAIKNNIFSTKNIADISAKLGVEEFVLVSTDKAVNPIGIMGISKKIDELYIQAISKQKANRTKFIIVRFGNVLDSSGSVIPLFKRQIETNSPITITHKEAKRFFMTPTEAAQLIIQAGAMGKGGEIFVLKMGDQIKIIDLLQDLINCYQIAPDKINITFTGLRKGEKLEEELIAKDETISLTNDENILLVNNNNSISYEWINSQIFELKKYLYKKDKDFLINKCKYIIENAGRR